MNRSMIRFLPGGYILGQRKQGKGMLELLLNVFPSSSSELISTGNEWLLACLHLDVSCSRLLSPVPAFSAASRLCRVSFCLAASKRKKMTRE